jgi:hypothetical protein
MQRLIWLENEQPFPSRLYREEAATRRLQRGLFQSPTRGSTSSRQRQRSAFRDVSVGRTFHQKTGTTFHLMAGRIPFLATSPVAAPIARYVRS